MDVCGGICFFGGMGLAIVVGGGGVGIFVGWVCGVAGMIAFLRV